MRSQGRIAVTHVDVVPMDREIVLHDQSVVIADGRIETVAEAGQVKTEGMRVIDGRGRWLMPALSDMHVHFWDPTEANLFLANGIAHVRNMWGTPLHLAWRQKVGRQEVPGPRLTTTSPIVDGAGPDGKTIWPGSVLLTSPEAAGPLVSRLAERGYQQVKAYSALQLEPLRALGSAAKVCGLPVTGHCPRAVTYEQAIDAGMTCFEHLITIGEGHMREGEPQLAPPGLTLLQLFRRLTQIDLEKVRKLAERMARDQIWNCPTLVAGVPARVDALATPSLEYVRASTRESWNPKEDFRTREVAWDEIVEPARAFHGVKLRMVGILREEGAPVLLGTDTPNPYIVPGFSIHRELEHLRSSGLSPYEAFRAGTAEAARFLGESEDWGTVAPGRRADLLLVARDPLRDVEAVRNIHHLFVNGHDFDRTALDELLAERLRDVSREIGPVTVGAGDVKWTIRHSGQPFGRLATKTDRTDEGTRIEEETATFEFGETHRHASANLDPHGRLKALRVTFEPGFGRHTLLIDRVPGGYRAHLTAIDGVVLESHVASAAAPLTPRLLISAAASFGSGEHSAALAFEDEQLILASALIAPVPESLNETKLTVTRPGEVLEFVLAFDEQGDLLRISQRMALGVREWVVDAPVTSSAP